MSLKDDEQGFLSRWSRRKRAVARELDAVESTPEVDESPLEQTIPTDSARDVNPAEPETAVADQGIPDEEARANREAAEAIDLDSLTEHSDISAFLKRGVPNALKNAALSRIWRSNPVFAVLDGLNDYDEDFRTVSTLKEGFRTSWAVGKGYADKAEEIAREMEEKSARLAELRLGGNAVGDEEASKDPVAREVPDQPSKAPADDEPLTAARVVIAESADVEEEPSVPKVGLRRRMQFGAADD